MLVWTAEARKQLVPRSRAGAKPVKRPAVGAAWGSVRQALRHHDTVASTFVQARKRADPPFDEWMEKAETIARTPTMSSFDDPNVAAVFAVLMAKHLDHALVTSIYPRQRGIVFAFEVALRMLEMGATGRPWYAHVRTTPPEPEPSWRATLLAEPDAIRAQCIDVGTQLWPTASLAQKTTIAYALFERTDWAAEVCRDAASAGGMPHEMLYPLVTDKDVACDLARKRTKPRSLLELVVTFGEDVLPLLLEIARAPRDNDARHLSEALAQFDDPRAAEALAPLVKYAIARPYVQAYFGRYPRFSGALAPIGSKIAREVHAGAKRAESATDGATATPGELPPIFRAPPWLEKTRPRRLKITLSVTPIERPITVTWQTGERVQALMTGRDHAYATSSASADTIATHALRLAQGRSVGFFVFSRERLPDSSTLAAWNAGALTDDAPAPERLRYAMARFGDSGLDGLVKFVDTLEHQRGDLSFLLRVGTPRIALGMAKLRGRVRGLSTEKTDSRWRLAWQWLRRNAAVAVLGLVPAAFRDDTRDDAVSVLVLLATAGTDVIRLAAPYGSDVKAALEKLLAYDATYDAPRKPPTLGVAWNAMTLTRPVTSAGKLLPLEAVDTIGAMLSFTAIEPPYAGIQIVKALCTPRSLAELSWDAARSWEHAGHKRREQWMLMSLVHFADDEVVRRMTPGIREDFAVDVLERMESTTALMELLTISGRAAAAGNTKLAERVEAILERAACLRGLDKDELEEELAPVKPLEHDGTVSLDFGTRKLRVGFDEHLEPYVIQEGHRVRALAPTRAGDDVAKALRAKELWRDLKEDVAVLAGRRIAGLKRAMSSGRTWTAARFHRVWIDNGLMKHLARGIVWSDATSSFRVAEDGSLSTSTDAAFTLAPDATVVVLHPLRAREDEIHRWRAIFADYRIIQPFAQLERVPLPQPSGERVPVSFIGGTASELTARVLARGFKRAPHVAGKSSFRRELTAEGAIRIEFGGSTGGPVQDVEIVFVGTNLDLIEIADIIDDLQSSAPSSLRTI